MIAWCDKSNSCMLVIDPHHFSKILDWSGSDGSPKQTNPPSLWKMWMNCAVDIGSLATKAIKETAIRSILSRGIKVCRKSFLGRMYRKILPWRMNRNRDNADNPNLACSSAEAKHVHCLSPPKKNLAGSHVCGRARRKREVSQAQLGGKLASRRRTGD